MGRTILGEEGNDQQDNFRDRSSETVGSSSLTVHTEPQRWEYSLSVPCSMVAASGKPRPLTPGHGILPVSHLENPRLCFYSLGFKAVGREGGILQLIGGLSPFFSLKPPATPSQPSQLAFEASYPPTPVLSISHPPRRSPPSAVLDAPGQPSQHLVLPCPLLASWSIPSLNHFLSSSFCRLAS